MVKRKTNKLAKNKKAFDEIIGDPFSYEESIDGYYMILKTKSSTPLGDSEVKSSSPVNQARPNPVDFFCDVESAVNDGLSVFGKQYALSIKVLKTLFDNTYYIGAGDIFSQKERARLEQILGNIFVKRGIYPVTRYFITIKK